MTQFDPPPSGTVVIHDGRAFTFIGNPHPHVTQDGRTVTLYNWIVGCVVCGKGFTIPMVAAPFGKPRQCCSKPCKTAVLKAIWKAKRKARNADPAVRSAKIKAGLAKRKARLVTDAERAERKAAAHERRKARDRARAKARYYAKKEAAQ